jgi:hypothetical protein
MRLIKIKISSQILYDFGYPNFFEALDFQMTPAGISNHIQKAERALMRFHYG